MTDHRHKPTVPEVLPLVRALYDRHSAGCCLHVVLDDGNVADAFIPGAVELATELGHADCLELARLLKQMSPTQRRKLGALKHTKGSP